MAVARFTKLKDLRNHLQHFDPPSFSYSLEDAIPWLNYVLDCGHLNWAMRRCFGSRMSIPLVELLLQRPVHFVPADPARPRIQQKPNIGYGSTNPVAVQAAEPAVPQSGPEKTYAVPDQANLDIRRS